MGDVEDHLVCLNVLGSHICVLGKRIDANSFYELISGWSIVDGACEVGEGLNGDENVLV